MCAGWPSRFRRGPVLPDGGDALSGLRSAHVLLSASACFAGWRRRLIRPTKCARPAFGAGLLCRMAATPYPAYGVRTSGFRCWPVLPDGGDALSGLQILPDGGGALSGLQILPDGAEPYPAYDVRRRHARSQRLRLNVGRISAAPSGKNARRKKNRAIGAVLCD